MLLVHINGVMQAHNVDYFVGKDCIHFPEPPPVGTIIQLSGAQGTLARLYGDGVSTTFHMIMDLAKQTDLLSLFEDVSKYHENPAVADALEQLRVVLALVKG
jgi:hypothetical protein